MRRWPSKSPRSCNPRLAAFLLLRVVSSGWVRELHPIPCSSKCKKGEPLKPVIPPTGLALITSPNAVFTKAPNPNAARVFTDYLFTLENMQLLADLFLYVGNPDVKYPKGLPALKDIKLMAIGGAELKKKNKPTRAKFKKLFGV